MSLSVQQLALPGLKLVTPKKHADRRGFFSETYNAKAFADAGMPTVFVQDNHSHSAEAGVVRGLHFQASPWAQDKLIRVVRGRLLDVVLDIRHGSPTYGEHVAVELSAENWAQLFVPIGFAHGFCTLVPGTEVLYKVSSLYAPQAEFGVLWNDPDLGIPWPAIAGAEVSPKDVGLPRWREFKSPFKFES